MLKYILIGFLIFITAILLIDLLVVGRNAHVISSREALIWSAILITMGISFYFILHHFSHLLHGIDTPEELAEIVNRYNPYLQFQTSTFAGMLEEYQKSQAMNYLSGYFIEKTLSIDNIFAILGLRSLFFLVTNLVGNFRFHKPGVAILLMFVGGKLLLANQLKSWGYQPEYSLYVIAAVMVFPKKDLQLT